MRTVASRRTPAARVDVPKAHFFLFARVCVVMTSTLGTACIDVSPRVVPAEAGADRIVESDVTSTDGGPSPCLSCIAAPNDPGPGCGSQWATCMTDPRCQLFVECIDEIGCFKIADRAEFIVCLSPCAPRIGLEGPTDPVLNIVSPVTLCARTQACAPTCNGSEPQ